MFVKIFRYVKDNFQCPQIVNIITNLDKENNKQNLKYILFLINVMTGNPDAVTRNKVQVMYDEANFLEVIFKEY